MNIKQFFESPARSLGIAGAVALALAGGFHSGGAQAANTAPSDVSASVVVPISIANSTPMVFGRFSSVVGTVVVSAASVRSSTGPVLFAGITPTAAAFAVTGDANATYTITLPADATVSVSDGVSSTMAVDAFSSAAASGTLGTLSGAGAQTVNVGATLSVIAVQVAGNYTGTFNVIVQYN